MHSNAFIHDMAIIMLVAGIVSLLFHRMRQPVVLGYLAAGIIIGPYTPPFVLIQNQQTINTLAELGVVFLMFSLGLEFSLKKLAKVGIKSLITALCETSLMLLIGYNLGRLFGWNTVNSLFLGGILAISSTTIIVKALGELHLKQQKFAQLIFGILIFEDILAIAIIAVLSGVATSGKIAGDDIFLIFGQLSLFMIVTLIVGLLTIPRLIDYIARFNNREMMLITVLGLCFGVCLLVIALHYSLALGAFICGAIIAESRALEMVEKLVEPLRDMFCAIFFVTIGMMFNPHILFEQWQIIFIVSLALILGKIIGNTFGSFLTGASGLNSLKVGMGLAQIGEFSFIIAALGASLHVISESVYPIAIAVSALTTLATPYLIKSAEPVASLIKHITPNFILRTARKYTTWVYRLKPQGESAMFFNIIFKIIAQIIINCTLVAAVFIAGAFVVTKLEQNLIFGSSRLFFGENVRRTVICGGALLISLPFLIAAYRKLKALSMILAEIWIPSQRFGKNTYFVRRIIFETLPVLVIMAILLVISSFNINLLPPPLFLACLLVGALIIAIVFQRSFIKWQSWLQIQLFKVMENKAPDKLV